MEGFTGSLTGLSSHTTWLQNAGMGAVLKPVIASCSVLKVDACNNNINGLGDYSGFHSDFDPRWFGFSRLLPRLL